MSLLEYPSAAQAVPPPPPPAAGATPTAAAVEQHVRSGMALHTSLQQADGHFPGDYGGPMFLMPGLIIACYVSGAMDTALPREHRVEMVRYLRNHQNADGGFGLHIEGHSTMFGTGLWCAAGAAAEHFQNKQAAASWSACCCSVSARASAGWRVLRHYQV
jgi:cycloartenol synthase